MTIELIIVRHAISKDRAKWKKRGLRDSDRPLTTVGKKNFMVEALGLTLLIGQVEQIFTSPYTRALQSARILADQVGAGKRPTTLKCLAPNEKPDRLLTELEQVTKGCYLLVGHEPDITKLIKYFLSAHFKPSWKKIAKGGAVRLSFTNKVSAHEGKLIWYLKPKALRELGKSFANSIPANKRASLVKFPSASPEVVQGSLERRL